MLTYRVNIANFLRRSRSNVRYEDQSATHDHMVSEPGRWYCQMERMAQDLDAIGWTDICQDERSLTDLA